MNIDKSLSVKASAPRSTPARVFGVRPPITGRSVRLPELLLRCRCFLKLAPLTHFALHLLLFPAACLNPERHGGDGKEVREERTQGEIFRRSGKGVTKSAKRSAEDGRQAAASRSERTREDAREEARAARKHDRKRRIGRQIVDRPPAIPASILICS